jgi:6-phosphogluconolactonase
VKERPATSAEPESAPIVRVFEDADAVARAAAHEFGRRARARVDAGERFSVALSGGSTPKRLFRLLAGEPLRREVPWPAIDFFWGDERTVPPDHFDSNFGAAYDLLLSRVEVPSESVHRIPAERPDPASAAAAYEEELRRHFRLPAGVLPRIDLVLLGMGGDGHTASLFPGSDALRETRRLVVAAWIEKLSTHRVTLTCPVLNNAACILFLVTGAEKAATLREVLEAAGGPARYPAQLIRPRDGQLVWYVDEAAAAGLSGRRGT